MARIVNKKEFLALPDDTLYREYTENSTISGDLLIKGISIVTDFWVQYLDTTDTDGSEEMIDMYRSGNVKYDLDMEQREAEFNEKAMYIVYDNNDVEQLIERLKKCVKG